MEQHWTGALPATLLFDASGRRRGFWEGPVATPELEKEIIGVLGQPAHS
ncbi:MAG TPA: hypothetical protein VFW45_13705 [Candidatus Polarisedimenticolia bacterium]|nr:hypothetical protein [Candidatus Polarisedimenticolia bacterium]